MSVMVSKYIEINRKAYDELAEQYQLGAESRSNSEESLEVLGGFALENIIVKPVKVLEVGSGSGQALSFFEHQRCITFGVEL